MVAILQRTTVPAIGTDDRPVKIMAPRLGPLGGQRMPWRRIYRAAGQLQLRLATTANIAPRGWYMLFLVDGNGFPLSAKWVQAG